MTDVWKSNARKFCEICKVWFADNKVSIEHHEAGRKHKEAIQAKLRQLGKQSRQKEKDQASLRSTLAAMESAAQKSMTSSSGDMAIATDLPCNVVGPLPKPRTYVDPRAHSSSVVEMAKEMARRKKEREIAKIATKSQHWRQEDDEESTEKNTIKEENKKEEEEVVWAEAKTTDGISYYFHIYSGETVWKAPDKFYTVAQYASRIAQMHDPQSPTVQSDDDSEQMRPLSAPRRIWGQEKQESAPEMDLNRSARRADLANMHELSSAPKEIPVDVGEIPAPGSYVASATADYYTAPLADGAAIAAAFRLEDHEIPLPPPPQDSHIETTTEVETTSGERKEVETKVKEELKDENENIDEKATTTVAGFKVKSEPVEDAQDSATSSERPRLPLRIGRPSPYGEWRKVEKPIDKPKIDYELPTEEGGRKTKKEEKIRPEDIVEFSEKRAPLSRKRAKDGTIHFKRRKVNISARIRED